MKDKQIIAQITLNADETLSKIKKAPAPQPPFLKLGNGKTNKQGMSSMDLIAEMVNMSQPALKLINWIKDEMVWNPITEQIEFITKITPKTDGDKQILKRGYKELFAKDIVRRVKRSHYMINPNAIITSYEEQMKMWDTLKSHNSQINTNSKAV